MKNAMTKQQNTAPVAEQEPQVQTFRPPVDIYETKDAYVLLADMPGVDKSAVQVNLERDLLTIEATSQVAGLPGLNYKRSFRVARGIDPDAVAATYNQGVLSVQLPKPEKEKPRNITVTAG